LDLDSNSKEACKQNTDESRTAEYKQQIGWNGGVPQTCIHFYINTIGLVK